MTAGGQSLERLRCPVGAPYSVIRGSVAGRRKQRLALQTGAAARPRLRLTGNGRIDDEVIRLTYVPPDGGLDGAKLPQR